MNPESAPPVQIAKSPLWKSVEHFEPVYRWDTPKEIRNWTLFRSQNTHYLTTALQTFDYPHNMLVLYRIVGRNEYKLLNAKWSCPENLKLMRQFLSERNSETLETRNIDGADVKWYIRLKTYQNRSGLKRFSTMPLHCFAHFWNRALWPTELSVEGSFQIPARLNVEIAGAFAPRVTLAWPGLLAIRDDYNASHERYPALRWMQTNCCGRIVPFSVQPSMFMEPIDDLHYTAEFEEPLTEGRR